MAAKDVGVDSDDSAPPPPPLPPVGPDVDDVDGQEEEGTPRIVVEREGRDVVERSAAGGDVANVVDDEESSDVDVDAAAERRSSAAKDDGVVPPSPSRRGRKRKVVAGDGGGGATPPRRGRRESSSASTARRRSPRRATAAAGGGDESPPGGRKEEEERPPIRRKRGRPPGSRNSKRSTTTTVTRHTFVFDSSGEGGAAAPLGMGVDETESGGCYVSNVSPDGTAHGLGVLRGDVIVHADNGEDEPGAEKVKDGQRAQDANSGTDAAENGGATTTTSSVAFDEFARLSKNRPLRITVTRFASAPTPSTAASPPRERRKRKNAGKSSRRLEEAEVAYDEARTERSLASTERSEAQVEYDRAKARLDAAIVRDEASERRLAETSSFLEQEKFLLFRPDWDVMYRRLCEFKKKNGHTWVKPFRKSRSKKKNKSSDEDKTARDDEGGPMTEGEGDGDGSDDEEDEENNDGAADDDDEEEGVAKTAGSAGDGGGDVDESTRREQLAEKKFRKWVDFQRTSCRRYLKMNDDEREAFKKHLTAEQFRMLTEEVGLILSHQEYLMGPQWDEMYEKLAAFRLANGHCNARKSGRNDDRMRLGIWVDRQRKFFKEGNLPPDKVGKLERLGFDFDIGPKKPAAFGDMLERLARYKEEHGDCFVPYAWREDEELAFWVTYQRSKGNKGRLTPEEFGALRDLGFVFNVREARWNQWIADLRAYKHEFGDCNVRRAPGPHLKLGNWCHQMRNQYTRYRDGQKSELTEGRIRQLEELGFSFRMQGTRSREAALKTEDEIWRDRYGLLKEYKDTHGHTRAASRAFPIKSKLKSWVALQRSQYKAFQEGRPTTMTEERIRLLKELSFDLTQGYTANK